MTYTVTMKAYRPHAGGVQWLSTTQTACPDLGAALALLGATPLDHQVTISAANGRSVLARWFDFNRQLELDFVYHTFNQASLEHGEWERLSLYLDRRRSPTPAQHFRVNLSIQPWLTSLVGQGG